MLMIMGVAAWFFPHPEKDDKLYNPALILVTHYVMTVSTSMCFISQVLSAFIIAGDLLKLFLVLSLGGQIIGMILFFISMWGRIRSVGNHILESKGERFQFLFLTTG